MAGLEIAGSCMDESTRENSSTNSLTTSIKCPLIPISSRSNSIYRKYPWSLHAYRFSKKSTSWLWMKWPTPIGEATRCCKWALPLESSRALQSPSGFSRDGWAKRRLLWMTGWWLEASYHFRAWLQWANCVSAKSTDLWFNTTLMLESRFGGSRDAGVGSFPRTITHYTQGIWSYHSRAGIVPSLAYHQQTLMVSLITYTLTTTIVKISLLLLYRRIFAISSVRLVSMIVIIVCVMWLLSNVLVVIFQCRPVSAFFNAELLFTNQCIDIQAFYTSITAGNLMLDLLILALPLYMVHGLQLRVKQKIVLSGIFALGALWVIFWGYRAKQLTSSAPVSREWCAL